MMGDRDDKLIMTLKDAIYMIKEEVTHTKGRIPFSDCKGQWRSLLRDLEAHLRHEEDKHYVHPSSY